LRTVKGLNIYLVCAIT